MKRVTTLAAALAAASLTVAACGGGDDPTGADPATGEASDTGAGATSASAGSGGSGGGSTAAGPRGPIEIWLSNNAEEVAWGTAMVDAWNADHPDEQISAQEIPAGKSSEEVIGAAITAGNTPCLIFNTAPVAVPQFEKQGGLVALSDFAGADEYITARGGPNADQFRSPDGKFYQMPWKANPVMIFYNKDIFTAAGIDAENPPLASYDDFLATSEAIVDSGAATAAIWPSPTSEFYQPWFDFYPTFAAESGGKQIIDDGTAIFAGAEGIAAANFWASLYADKLSPNEAYNGDAFADGESAMSIVGPWAVPVYSDVDWGVVPIPTSTGKPASDVYTFDDAKNVAMYSSCENTGTAWDVLQFATSEAQDRALLEATGQMPLRQDLPTAYADYFTANPAYTIFADQANRTVGVPIVANSIEVWQTLRDAYSSSVIFPETPIEDAFSGAAGEVDDLVAGS